jgi:hypothetical protein
VEDAQAAMALYRLVRGDYEKAVRMGHLHGMKSKEERPTKEENLDQPALDESRATKPITILKEDMPPKKRRKQKA